MTRNVTPAEVAGTRRYSRRWMRCTVAKRDDWALEVAKGKPVEMVREIRDEIRKCVPALIDAEGWALRPDCA